MISNEEADTFNLPIYFDNAATTPLDPRVLDGMFTVLREDYGNASSTSHPLGRRARDLVEHARRQVASLIGASAEEIVFTSGATESSNMAIRGISEVYADRGKHLIVSLVEHKAVIEPCRRLEREGYSITWLKPDQYDRITADQVAEAIRSDTILVCVMAVNNVTGTINPVDEIGRVCKRRGVMFFCDATQAAGHVPIDVEELGVDLLAMSAHKIHGPKGSGSLYIRGRAPRVRMTPFIDGGGQERGLRSGTVNTAGIVGMGLACEIAKSELSRSFEHMTGLCQHFERRLTNRIPDLQVLGHPSLRAPHIISVLFPGVDGSTLLKNTPDLMASTGAACGPANVSPLMALQAAGHSADEANAAVRFSFGRFNTEAEIEYAIDVLAEAVKILHSRV